MQEALEEANQPVAVALTMGPDERLVRAMAQRLREAAPTSAGTPSFWAGRAPPTPRPSRMSAPRPRCWQIISASL
ncbi:hypothetical protein [Nesterenkonia pannonica]|uniref:hypothetical protein n=1 Tax=Nesterenkonia pannonica TaxID=1548602 RepID=UPI0021640F2F|nr:hypothetical protein [Nesterenkonia pannonica]